jgi:UDP-N-acetylmuramoyl-tripeptide--D-alanyl-D-alanine ligase
MVSKKVNPSLQKWLSPKLPIQHVYIDKSKLSDNYKNIFSYIKHYVVHPVKRRIAKHYLQILKKVFNLKVIGITGSAGKTTTKDMLYSILERDGRTVASYKNIDPVFSIPSTILKCTPFTKYLVLELGVEFPGEMEYYLWLAKPDVGVITNISATHTEFFGDVGGVFKEKSKLAEFMSGNDTAVLNIEDKFLSKLRDTMHCKIVWFGNGGDVKSSQEKLTRSGTKFRLIFNRKAKSGIWVKIPVVGEQFVQNTLAAAAVANILGFKPDVIKIGLESFSLPEHRMKVLKIKGGATIFDDSYNNNPEAARRAIDTLYSYAGNRDRVVVFGDMLELGKWETKYHGDLGKYLSKKPYLVKLICIGKASEITAKTAVKYIGKSRVSYYKNWGEAVDEVRQLSKRKTVMLIKGSRSIELDKLVAKLR